MPPEIYRQIRTQANASAAETDIGSVIAGLGPTALAHIPRDSQRQNPERRRKDCLISPVVVLPKSWKEAARRTGIFTARRFFTLRRLGNNRLAWCNRHIALNGRRGKLRERRASHV
jgi:hypothetical protein